MSPTNIIDRLQFMTQTIKKHRKDAESVKFTENIRKMIEYVSEHFSEISFEKMKTVEIDILEEIIKNNKLRLEDEDSLLHLVLDLYEESCEYATLFEYVQFKHLKVSSVREFISRFDIETLSVGTWRSISDRLVNSCDSPCECERYISKELTFSHHKGEEFKGIMRHLTDETGGNIHDNGTIEITSNSVCGSNCPRNIVDYERQNVYQMDNKDKSEICFDFKDRRIAITGYTLKSPEWGQNNCYLKNWIVEVSHDQQSWEVIDKQDNNSNLNGSNLIATFNTKESNLFYRFVRLRQTGNNWANYYHSGIISFEFYGKLKQT